jgi:hypothetical protein
VAHDRFVTHDSEIAFLILKWSLTHQFSSVGSICAAPHRLPTATACAASESGKEALAHAASISSGGAPMLMVVTDDA